MSMDGVSLESIFCSLTRDYIFIPDEVIRYEINYLPINCQGKAVL